MEAIKMQCAQWVWNHTPNCAEMSRLSSRSLEQPLSFRTRLKMRLHFLICVWCKRYQKHLQFLHRAAPQLTQQLDTAAHRPLTTEARERIKFRLREAVTS